MSKKSGKKAPAEQTAPVEATAAAEVTPAPTEATAPATGETKAKKEKMNIQLPAASIEDRTSSKDGKAFKSIYVYLADPRPGHEGEINRGTFTVNPGQVKDATKPVRDGDGHIERDESGAIKREPLLDKSGTPMKDIYLPNNTVKVQFSNKVAEGKYERETVPMQRADFIKAVDTARKDYKAQHADKTNERAAAAAVDTPEQPGDEEIDVQ
jgi:hypothetical protein